jgi:hypothetical protein
MQWDESLARVSKGLTWLSCASRRLRRCKRAHQLDDEGGGQADRPPLIVRHAREEKAQLGILRRLERLVEHFGLFLHTVADAAHNVRPLQH